MEILQYLAPLGVGGILAAFIFTFYVKSEKVHKDDLVRNEKEKMNIIEEYSKRLEHHINNQRQDRETLIDTLERVNTSVGLGNELHRNLANEIKDLARELVDSRK